MRCINTLTLRLRVAGLCISLQINGIITRIIFFFFFRGRRCHTATTATMAAAAAVATTAMYTIIACVVCVMFVLIEAGSLTNSGLFSRVFAAISAATFSALLKYFASSHLFHG